MQKEENNTNGSGSHSSGIGTGRDLPPVFCEIGTGRDFFNFNIKSKNELYEGTRTAEHALQQKTRVCMRLKETVAISIFSGILAIMNYTII